MSEPKSELDVLKSLAIEVPEDLQTAQIVPAKYGNPSTTVVGGYYEGTQQGIEGLISLLTSLLKGRLLPLWPHSRKVTTAWVFLVEVYDNSLAHVIEMANKASIYDLYVSKNSLKCNPRRWINLLQRVGGPKEKPNE